LLEKNHPSSTPGNIFVELSKAHRPGFTNSGMAGGCEAAQEFTVNSPKRYCCKYDLQPMGMQIRIMYPQISVHGVKGGYVTITSN
jgi:hypothetical protein